MCSLLIAWLNKNHKSVTLGFKAANNNLRKLGRSVCLSGLVDEQFCSSDTCWQVYFAPTIDFSVYLRR